MGLKEDNGNDGKIFLSIYEGRIKREVTKDTPNAFKRENQAGRIVYEKYYKSISGNLIRIQKRHHDDYGWSYTLVIREEKGDEDYYFSFPCSSRQTNGFFRRLPNIKLDQPIEIKCGIYDEKPYLTVFQNGEKVDYFWTQENPGKLPDMKELTVKGEKVWDDTDRIKFFDWCLETKINPMLEVLYPADHIEPAPEPEPEEFPTQPLPPSDIKPAPVPPPPPPGEDDLPF